MVIDRNVFSGINLEDYVAIKEKAYNFAKANLTNKNYFKDVNDYIINGLDFRLTDREAMIFSATALYPYDREICELYNNQRDRYLELKKSNIVLRDKFEMKEMEIEMFHLDALIGEYLGMPIIPKVTCKDEKTVSTIFREK